MHTRAGNEFGTFIVGYIHVGPKILLFFFLPYSQGYHFPDGPYVGEYREVEK